MVNKDEQRRTQNHAQCVHVSVRPRHFTGWVKVVQQLAQTKALNDPVSMWKRSVCIGRKLIEVLFILVYLNMHSCTIANNPRMRVLRPNVRISAFSRLGFLFFMSSWVPNVNSFLHSLPSPVKLDHTCILIFIERSYYLSKAKPKRSDSSSGITLYRSFICIFLLFPNLIIGFIHLYIRWDADLPEDYSWWITL